MKKNHFVLVILNFAIFFGGLASIFLIDLNLTPFSLKVHPSLDLAVLFVAFFALSTLYSGKITPPLFLYYGLINSEIVFSNPLGITVSVLPLLIASYGGSITGFYSTEDLNEKKNFFDIKNTVLLIFIGGFFLAIATGFLVEYLSGLDQLTLLPFLLKNTLL